MIHNKKFRAYFITLIFILSILSVVFIPSENVKAADNTTGSSNKIYFADKTISNIFKTNQSMKDMFPDEFSLSNITNFEETILTIIDNLMSNTEGGITDTLEFISNLKKQPSMTSTAPTSTEDIIFPPDPLILSPKRTENGEFISWALLWLINKAGEELTEKASEYLGGEINYQDLIELITGGEIDLNPLKMTHVYNIEDTRILSGDFKFNLYHSNYIPSRLSSSKIASFIEDFYPLGIKDQIKVQVYKANSEEKDVLICDHTVDVENNLFDKINNQIINAGSASLAINKGEKLKFSVEVIPGETKPIDFFTKDLNTSNSGLITLIESIGEIALSIAETMKNQDQIEILKEYGKELENITQLIIGFANSTLEDSNNTFIYDFFHDATAASIIYGSSSHTSYVDIPLDVKGQYTVDYLLHDENKLIDSENFDGEQKKLDLSENEGSWSTVNSLSRSKIIKQAQANIYIDYHDLKLINRDAVSIVGELYDVKGNNEDLIKTSEYELDFRSSLLNSNKIVIDFGEINEEIPFDHNLKLKINAEFDKGILGLTRDSKILFNDEKSPSSLTVEYEDTDHIQINSIQIGDDKKYTAEDFPNIYPMAAGENEFFVLNVTSKYAEELKITTSKESNNWEIELIDDSYDISKDGYVLIPFYVNHTFENLEAYENDDSIYVELEVGGKTGLDKLGFLAEVSYEGVDYDVLISDLSTKFVETGKTNSLSFSLENNNNGLKIDDYELSVKFAKEEWKASLSDESFDGVEAKEKLDFNIKVNVPKDTDLEKNVLMITVTSKESGESFVFNVTTKVKNPSIFEMIYNVFQDAAESMGLDSILGDFAGGFLLFVVLFIILIFVIAAIVIIKKEYMEVICVDRVREISADEAAEYTITVHNPSNKTMNYQINVERKTDSEGWMVTLDKDSVMVEPKGFKSVNLTVEPSDLIESDDWIEVKITVRAIEKQKIEELSVITTITDQKPDLRISGMFHWPRAFREGDKVTTSFKLENKGGVAAKNVNVVLKVNGEVKNKVENIDIPRGGFAEIEIPWIAEKGKNEVDIEVNQ
jgi:hypothetical protein